MGSPKGHIPIRTCISCRTRQNKQEMIRLVLDERGLLADDPRRRKPGRGRYVCPKDKCIDALQDNRKPKASPRKRPFKVEDGLLEKLKSLSLSKEDRRHTQRNVSQGLIGGLHGKNKSL